MNVGELADLLIRYKDQEAEVLVEHTPTDSISIAQGVCAGYEPITDLWPDSEGLYLVHTPQKRERRNNEGK